MKKVLQPISILESPDSVTEFDKLPICSYLKSSPPFSRVFNIPEKWFIKSGDTSFTDGSTGMTMTAKTGDVIVCPQNSKFSKMRFSQDTSIKQYIDDIEERNKISTNIKINYLIIKTILQISGLYDDFVSVPFDSRTDWIFESAEEGDLYQFTDNWEAIDMVIQNFVDRTGISENVWYGKRRLKTGLRYNKPNWDNSLSIDYIDDISNGTRQQQKEQYNLLKNDPLDLISQNNLKVDLNTQSLYTLENLVTFVAIAIKEEEKSLLKNVFPSNISLRQPRNSSKYKNGMPPYLLYGRELSTVIKQLFWTTSVGFENRLGLL